MDVDGHGHHRGVLQPARNRNLTVIDSTARRQLKKPPVTVTSPRPLSSRRNKDPNLLKYCSATDHKPNSPRSAGGSGSGVVSDGSGMTRRNLKGIVVGVEKCGNGGGGGRNCIKSGSVAAEGLFDMNSPGKLAAAQRDQAMMIHAERKMKIAHYGRAVNGKMERKVKAVPLPPHLPVVELDSISSVASPPSTATAGQNQERKRCSFITPNSDPLFVKYHDEEWGVPVHDDRLLFELLALTGAQIGLDWTTIILKKRDEFRSAFAGFDAEQVSRFSEKQIAAVATAHNIDSSRVRGIVDNSLLILEVKKKFGSLDKYLWMFVNNKPISTKYKSCRKIPIKTSKSDSISKDMVRRGFRLVGPTIIQSFMQAAGLTNDHLVSCPQHSTAANSL